MSNMLKLLLSNMFFITFLSASRGKENLWFEPQIFEYGKSMTLNCNVTEKTKAVAWWVVREDRSPKKISDKLVLNFESANHSHSATYECFHTFENNDIMFVKYSRKALVIESHCTRVITNESTIVCQFKHINFLNVDDCDHVECDGSTISSHKATHVVDKMKIINVNYTLNFGAKKCAYGCENSKIPSFLNGLVEPQQIQVFLATTESISRMPRQNETSTADGGPIITTSFLFRVILSMGLILTLAIVLMTITFVAGYCKLKRRSRPTSVVFKEDDVTREVPNYEKLHQSGANENQVQLEDVYSVPVVTTNDYIHEYDSIKEPHYLKPIVGDETNLYEEIKESKVNAKTLFGSLK